MVLVCLCVLGKVIANRTVDYEEVHWLNFTVRASDNGSPPRAAEIPVYLEIVDINDNNPIFDQPSYQVGGQANKLGVGPVPIPWGLWSSFSTTLPASKPHGNGSPMSSLIPGLSISVSSWTGGLMSAYSVPLPSGLQEAVSEDVPVGTVILTVSATDADSGNFALIEYSLVDGEGKFAVNPATVSWKRRAWLWGVGRAEQKRLRSHQKYCSYPRFSGSCRLELCNVRGFLAESAGLVPRVPDIPWSEAFLSQQTWKEVARVFWN